MARSAPLTQAVPAWDLFLRLFHWSLAALMVASVTTGLLGGNLMKWHMWSGYGILGLLAFRLVWGFLGGPTARFSAFLRGPGAVWVHVQDLLARRPSFHLGHNPLGGWMVLLMLLAVLFQAVTGLFANDDIATEGPLYAYISKELSDRLTGLHKLNVKLLYGLVGLHVAAIAFYFIARGENLVGPMIHGRKTLPPPNEKDPT